MVGPNTSARTKDLISILFMSFSGLRCPRNSRTRKRLRRRASARMTVLLSKPLADFPVSPFYHLRTHAREIVGSFQLRGMFFANRHVFELDSNGSARRKKNFVAEQAFFGRRKLVVTPITKVRVHPKREQTDFAWEIH